MRTNGRRSVIDWTAASNEGDASAASADLDAWLAERPPARPAAEWDAAFGALRDGLARLMASRLVQQDPGCREILARLDGSSRLEELDAAMDALGRRVAALSAPAPSVATSPVEPADRSETRERRGAWRSILRLR